jgi:hypothetical protein
VRPTEFLNDWSERDRELAIATTLARGGDCPGCGHAKSETWVDASDLEHEYIAEEVQCVVCARLESARAGTKNQKGLHYYVVKRPRGSSHATDEPVDDVE